MKINELAAVIFSMFIVKFLYDAPIDAVFILPIFFIGFYLLFNGFALVSTTIIYIYKADKYDRIHGGKIG